jgi:hypothetical protein
MKSLNRFSENEYRMAKYDVSLVCGDIQLARRWSMQIICQNSWNSVGKHLLKANVMSVAVDNTHTHNDAHSA